MALRGAWWMTPTSQSGVPVEPLANLPPQAPYKSWIRSIATQGLTFNDLQRYLKANPGNGCRISKVTYGDVNGRLLWRKHCVINDIQKLEAEINNQWTSETFCHLYLITALESEALELLAFYLDITPRFFNIPAMIVNTGAIVEKFVFFSLQLFEKYSTGVIPAEAKRIENPPRIVFRVTNGFAPHEWMLTRISLIFMRRKDGKYNGVVNLDPYDTAFRDGIIALAVKDEGPPAPGLADNKLGLADTLTTIFYIIQFNWGVFIQESEDYMKVLSKTCIEQDLTSAEQLVYTRELHKVSPLWVEARRRIVCASDLTEQMIVHPFFAVAKARESIEAALRKTKLILDDHAAHTIELSNQTNVLISLIFNIATLQDTRAAVEESKAANQLASSIQRVTILTFIYLPLSLAAGIFGMNVQEMSGEDRNPPWWSFLVLASSLAFVTVAIWAAWSWHIKQKKRKQGKSS